jgi:hypothetical protein
MPNNPSELDARRELIANPACGYEYLHHVGVEIWRRRGEDEPGEVIRVDATGFSSTAATRGFVGRRDSPRILFSCERCPTKSVLVIWQHKGRADVSSLDNSLRSAAMTFRGPLAHRCGILGCGGGWRNTAELFNHTQPVLEFLDCALHLVHSFARIDQFLLRRRTVMIASL